MKIIDTPIADLKIFEPAVWEDERGYFMESFRAEFLASDFIQDNESSSTYGVLRGLHYQVHPHAQSKLVRVVQGEVLDVVVDIRPKSATYGKYFSIRLSADNKRQLLVPAGFAHGYVVLSETAIFLYKCDAYYSREHEGGIRFDDQTIGIDWQIPRKDMVISAKDQKLPPLGQHRNGPWA